MVDPLLGEDVHLTLVAPALAIGVEVVSSFQAIGLLFLRPHLGNGEY